MFPHQRLLRKVKSFNINGGMLRWIVDFLKGKKRRVVVNYYESNWFEVISSIPQDSVLSPLFFSCILMISSTVFQIVTYIFTQIILSF